MSLRVWLPLMSDLKNNGASDLTFSVVNSSTTVSSGGKIGANCYYNNSNTSGGIISNKTIELGQKQSMFCWFKFTSLMSNSSLGGALVSQHRHSSNCGMGITIKYVSSTTGYLSVNTGNGSSRTFNSYCGTTLLQANTWYHGGYTYDGTNIRIYVNGNLENTVAYANMSVPADYLTVFCWSFSSTSGTDIHGNYKLYGYINDVRVYDHCLSDKEVKEISKGLVAHYPLNNNGAGNANLLKTPVKSYNSSIYNAYQFNLSENLVAGNVYTMQLWDVNVAHSGKSSSQLSINIYWGGGMNSECSWSVPTGHADYLVKTFTAQSGGSATDANNLWLNIYNSVPNADGTRSMSIGKWKLEKGSVATPWVPNTTDAEYSSLGFNSNIAYDVSGYCNNGTFSSSKPIVNSESIRYGACTEFNGTDNFIACGRGAMIRDTITVNVWGYMSDWSTYNARLTSCTEGGGWNFEPSSGKLAFALGTGETSNTYKSVVTSDAVLNSLSSGWHMFTGTYDGFNVKIYVDGVLKGTNAAYTTKTSIFYNASNGIFIGAESGGNTTTPAGGYFNGKISDVRVYATCLSESDIKELYSIPISIDNKGNIYALEYNEV